MIELSLTHFIIKNQLQHWKLGYIRATTIIIGLPLLPTYIDRNTIQA